MPSSILPRPSLCEARLSATVQFMTRTALAILLACVALASSCTPLPAPSIIRRQYTGANGVAYRRGYQSGFQDGLHKRGDEYERHHGDYTSATAQAFEQGYKLGFDTGEDQASADDDDRDKARDQGEDAGRTDAENGLSPFYQRHRRDFRPDTESSFRS